MCAYTCTAPRHQSKLRGLVLFLFKCVSRVSVPIVDGTDYHTHAITAAFWLALVAFRFCSVFGCGGRAFTNFTGSDHSLTAAAAAVDSLLVIVQGQGKG